MSGFVSITDFGAVGDGVTDNHDAIQRAFDYGNAHGVAVFIPAGTFAHSGALIANGIAVFGAGDSSVLKSTQYGHEALVLTGANVSLSDLHMVGVAGPRLATDASVQVLVRDAGNFDVQNVHIDGSSSVGIMTIRSAAGHIADNTIENTRADSIHMVQSSHDILVEQNTIMHSGDDGISAVSYQGLGTVHDITIRDNNVLSNDGGRGIAVVGGNTVLVEHNNIVGGSADRAGIYIAAEQEFNTESAHNVRVTGNTITDAGGVSSGHGAITVFNSQAGLVNDGIVIADNQIDNPRTDGIRVLGANQQDLDQYGNRLEADGNHQLLANFDPGAHIDSDQPPTETNIIGTDAPESLFGTASGEALYGFGGDDLLNGGGGNDLLDGGPGNDMLVGGPGDDRLFGGDGNDILDGGPGNDVLVGGAGADLFVFGPGYGQDTVTAFEPGIDKIDLRGFGFTTFDQVQAAIATGGEPPPPGVPLNVAPGLHLDFGHGDQLYLPGISHLTAADVIL